MTNAEVNTVKKQKNGHVDQGSNHSNKSTVVNTEVSTAKKRKFGHIEQAPDKEWPECWYIPERVEDQKALNKLIPYEPASAAILRKIGLRYVM